MKYKKHIQVRTDKGVVSFSPDERSKLLFTYVCPSCKSRRQFNFINDYFIYDLDFYYYSGCCDSFKSQELKISAKEKLGEINKEAPALIDKLRQISKAFPVLFKDLPFFLNEESKDF